MTCTNRRWAAIVATLLGIGVAGQGALAPGSAHAQAVEDTTFEEVDASPKATVGLGLIGAELGLVVPALAGLDQTWAFIAFPVAGAAGGAAAGYFLIDKDGGSPELAVASLTVGMALVIPALVATLALTAYDPEREPRPEEIARAAPRRAEPREPGLVRWSERGVQLGVPEVASLPVNPREDVRQLGVPQRTELRMALLSGSF